MKEALLKTVKSLNDKKNKLSNPTSGSYADKEK